MDNSDLAQAALLSVSNRSGRASTSQNESALVTRVPRKSARRSWSGAKPDERDPQLLATLLNRVVRDRKWSGRLAEGDVFHRWSTLVGGEVAEHTSPTALSEGVLTVRAESTAWATQLRMLQRQIIKRIADGVGDGVVKRLRVQGPAAPSWRHGPRHITGRGPRDTYG